MGSSGSKSSLCGSTSSSPSDTSWNGRKGRSKGSRVFQSACLGISSGSCDNNGGDYVCDNGHKEVRCIDSSCNQTEIESDQSKTECYRTVKVEQSDERPCISSNVEHNECSQASITNTAPGNGSSPACATSTQPLTSPSRFLSRCSLIPGNVSFRLSRATSLGSSRAYNVPTKSLRMLNDEEAIHPRSTNGIIDGIEIQGRSIVRPTSLTSRSPLQGHRNTSASLRFHSRASDFLDDVQDNQTIPFVHDIARDGASSFVRVDGNSQSPRICNDLHGIENRLSDRRIGVREPIENNVRFSRTLSVGRLRDRVLRRSSLTDLMFCPSQQERELTDATQGNRRQPNGGEMRVTQSEGDVLSSPTTSSCPPSGMSSSMLSNQDHGVETSRSREARYHDLLENRSNFLERRRRIRSQVRALQRSGSRFENMSGHERSCILYGQHRTSRCTCRVSNRDANLNDDTSARASISRIVMLAEALFEVLDEIHQQSVVLSSRPSVSSLGSVPAPNDVVESLPVKSYSQCQKYQNEEAAQCYICLVEYEEGDSIRVLPCHHEFHQACIDKWLKEIHRVCPLCRSDICQSESLPVES